ncbi:MAG: hypothetical protein RIC30_15830 [Marinoscillum sp.]|uniref:hypothetical protein n=1 Tax=Marinoscillum sp. TaxID=2024838 RepID=UPI0032FF1D4B
MRSGIVLMLGVWLAVSCQEIKDCTLETSTDYSVVRFYRADTTVKTVKEVAFMRIYEPDVSNYNISTMEDNIDDDTIVVTGLFLNPADTRVTYLFETDSIDYELTMEYKPHLRIYYDECDPVYSYKLDTAYSPNFDSVAMVNNVLDKVVTTNLEIYL